MFFISYELFQHSWVLTFFSRRDNDYRRSDYQFLTTTRPTRTIFFINKRQGFYRVGRTSLKCFRIPSSFRPICVWWGGPLAGGQTRPHLHPTPSPICLCPSLRLAVKLRMWGLEGTATLTHPLSLCAPPPPWAGSQTRFMWVRWGRWLVPPSTNTHQYPPPPTNAHQHSPTSTTTHQHPPPATNIHQHPQLPPTNTTH